MLAFSNDYYGMIFRATQSVELFCAYYGIIKNKDNDYYDFYQIFSKLTSEDKEFVLAMMNKLYKEKEV